MEPPVWTADIGIDTALASRLIAGAFPQLAVQAVEPFGSGWDNAAFLADGRIVFRFPRRRAVANLIEREIALLPLLAPRLPLAISVPVYIGAASPAYPWAFAGYECITGTTACALSLDNRTRHSLALPLARFLHALHGIAADPLVAAGLPPDELGRLDPDKRLRLARERLPVLEAAGIDARGAVAWLAANPPQALAERERTVVHGDLYARHVLVDARRKPTGVIDWGDIHLGDPALDIAIAHMLLPANAHAAFRDAYGPIDERTWRAARYRALYHAILEIEYGIRENDAGMRDCGTATLRLADVLN